MDTIQVLYENQVKVLTVYQRLELMRLIMDDLAQAAPRWVVDINDEWSDDDLHDLSQASLAYATATLLGEADDA